MNKYILWDLDGTIVESEDVVFKSKMFRSASEKHGLFFDLQPDEFIGREGRHIFGDLLRRNNVGDTNELYFQNLYDPWYEDAVLYIKENIKDVLPRENIVEVWQAATLAGIKHAIVTSSREDIAIAYLASAGLIDYCQLLVCLNHVSKCKPDPEPYLLAMEKLGITPNDCIAVEDSYSGIKSATDAGIYTVAWVKDTDDPKYSLADFRTSAITTATLTSLLLNPADIGMKS